MVWICLAQSVLDWCSIDRNLNSECFKKSFLTCSSLFSKLFKHSSHYCRPIKIRTMSVLKRVFSRVLHYFQNFLKSLLTTFLQAVQSKPFFCRFLPQISQGFLSSSTFKSLLPFLFQLNHMIHAFSFIFVENFAPSIFGIFVYFIYF